MYGCTSSMISIFSFSDYFWIPGVRPWLCCTSGHRKWFFRRLPQHKYRLWTECGYGCAHWWKSVRWDPLDPKVNNSLFSILMTINNAICFTPSHRSSYECSCFVHNVRVRPFALEDAATVCFRPVSGFLPRCWDHFFTLLRWGGVISVLSVGVGHINCHKVTSLTSVLCFIDAIHHYCGGNFTVSGPKATAGIFATYPAPYISIYTGFLDQVFQNESCAKILLNCTR